MKYVKRAPIKEDEIYALFVGVVVVPEVESIMNTAKKDFGWEINYTVMTEEEFDFRKKRRDPFVLGILSSSKIMVLGDEQEFVN